MGKVKKNTKDPSSRPNQGKGRGMKKGKPKKSHQQAIYEKQLKVKQEKQQEKSKQHQERAEALSKYQTLKRQKEKKIHKRTYRGQPVLANQLEVMLAKYTSQNQ